MSNQTLAMTDELYAYLLLNGYGLYRAASPRAFRSRTVT